MGSTPRSRARRLSLQTPLLLASSGPAQAQSRQALDLSVFERTDGAIMLYASPDSWCDPYFAMKGMLIAQSLGLDVSNLARRFAAWLIPRQNQSGSFDRFVWTGTQWQVAARADADDSTCALWMQMLCKTHFPPHYEVSFQRAFSLLASLRSKQGTYNISPELPVQLLMDNCEIYESFVVCGQYFATLLQPRKADSFQGLARRLRSAIHAQFHLSTEPRWRVSSQADTDTGFYPLVVAQLYPLLAGLEGTQSSQLANDWFNKHGKRWLSGQADQFSWGLMAVAFAQMGRQDIVTQWLEVATHMRATPNRWNVLEECIWQALRVR